MELLIALAINISITLILIVVLKNSINSNSTYDNTPIFFITMILNIIIVICLICSLKKPKAIDVYKGNTTLEITYKENIPIDSVVVWKDR